MMKTLHQMIFRRRSVRKYLDREVSQDICEKVLACVRSAGTLSSAIRVEARIVAREDVRFYLPWKAPHLLAVYCEEKEGCLEEVGFRLQQVDLFIQSMGLGSCWMGLGKLRKEPPETEGLRFVILIAFGYPDGVDFRSDVTEFSRRSLDEISDKLDERLEPARLAPSSTNSQPWYFLHEDEMIHVYQSKAGLLRHRLLGEMNRIDVGIALAHLFVSYPEGFRCVKQDAPEVKGYRYVCSIGI